MLQSFFLFFFFFFSFFSVVSWPNPPFRIVPPTPSKTTRCLSLCTTSPAVWFPPFFPFFLFLFFLSEQCWSPDIECDSGSYLPFGSSQCAPCLAGQYSLGGGEVISQWTSLAPGMSSDCTGTNCSRIFLHSIYFFLSSLCWLVFSPLAWLLNGTFIGSGNNYGRNNIKTNLRLFAQVTILFLEKQNMLINPLLCS